VALQIARRSIAPALMLMAGISLLASDLQGAAMVKHDLSCVGEHVVLDSGRLSLIFKVSGDRLSFTGLSGDGGPEWLADFSEPESLWRLELRGPDGSSKEVGSGEVALSGLKTGESKVDFTWKVPLADQAAVVTMGVRCETGSPISCWSLRAKLPDGWKVTRADFPVIPNIELRRGLKLAAPAGWGLEYDVKPGAGYEGTYPSCVAAMQFVAFYHRGRGLYIGMHDPQANHKHLSVKAREDAVGFTCANWPAIPEKGGGTYKLPFEAAVGVFDGDYYDAAQIYRAFTFTAPWGKAGPVSKRPIPRWVKDTDLWLRPDGSPEENVEITQQALKYFDVPTSLHWYRWHVIPFDTLYPEYFPPLPGFAEGIKALQDAGTHVMPYINGRLCDPNSKTWNDERGYRSAARQENGEPYTEVYGSKVPLNVMCPYTAQWQDKIAGLVDRLIKECGVDGIYIDQISAAPPKLCFDPSHGHPIGGGHFWVDGYRKLLDLVRSKLPKDRMITTEESAECWIDQFDALLLVNTPITAGTPIPLFPAVYSGRTITFGFLYFPADDLERSLPFRAKMARCFVYGSQLGWIQPSPIMAPEAAKEAEFLKNLARCRRFGHDFLTYGRFLGLLSARGDNPRMKGEGSGSFGGTYRIDLPAVLASAWLSEDGKLGIALANMSDEAHDVELRLPLDKAGILASKGFKVEVYGSEGLISSTTSRSASQKIEVPARGAVILSVSRPETRR